MNQSGTNEFGTNLEEEIHRKFIVISDSENHVTFRTWFQKQSRSTIW
jgi:hypothetical protein